MFKLFMCAICQVEIKPGEGISIHVGCTNRRSRPWDGPFLCQSCQEKREAMEGKRPSGGLLILNIFVKSTTHFVKDRTSGFIPILTFLQIDIAVEATS